MNRKNRLLAVSLAVILLLSTLFTNFAMASEESEPIVGIRNQVELSPEAQICYVVQEGDTLYAIGRDNGITVGTLMRYNGLSSTLIKPGQKIYLPTNYPPVAEVLSRSNISVSREDIMLMARLIHAEARGESFIGKVAVGAVILNRLDSPLFPHTIYDVIMERNSAVYQFSPVGDGTINLDPCESSIQAAIQALSGDDPTGGALFFYNPDIATDRWIRTLPVITRIGNHVFAATKA